MAKRIVPITRFVYLDAYLHVLDEVGSPFPRRMHRFGLPSAPLDPLRAFVPVEASIDFLTAAARHDGIEDLAFLGVSAISARDLSDEVLDVVRSRATLLDALRVWCRLSALEDNCINFWLMREQNAVRLCNRLTGVRASAEHQYAQWVQNKMALEVVRLYLGPKWEPRAMGFEASFCVSAAVSEWWPRTALLTGQSSSWIEIALEGLAAPPWAGPGAACDIANLAAPPKDMIGVLKFLIPEYLSDGYLPVHSAAKIVGISVRTLQRELRSSNCSYRRLVEEARYQRAVALLRQSSMRTMEIAHAVGYDDPSHFTRAFRRMCGMTPSQFRASQHIEAEG